MEFEGVKVIDSSKPLKINVTDEDILKGEIKDPTCCAAALAIKRICRADDARVHLGRTYVRKKNVWLRYETPASLRAEIIAFDRGGAFVAGEHILGKVRPSHFVGSLPGTAPRSKRLRSVPLGKRRDTGRKRDNHVTVGVRYSATHKEARL